MRERTVNVNGAELWVAEQGKGKPLVLCTGGLGFCDYLEPIAEILDDLVLVYRFDPRGCGRSSLSPPYDFWTMLLDLEQLRLALGHESWIVDGHSAGADVALAYALEFPERVEALICISGGRVHDDRQWHTAYEAGLAAGLDDRLDVAYPFNQEVNRATNDSYKEYTKRPDLLSKLNRLEMPAFFLYGGKDIRPSWPVEQIASLLPKGTFESISGAGHCQWLSRPDELRARLRGFLSGVLGTSASGQGPA